MGESCGDGGECKWYLSVLGVLISCLASGTSAIANVGVRWSHVNEASRPKEEQRNTFKRCHIYPIFGLYILNGLPFCAGSCGRKQSQTSCVRHVHTLNTWRACARARARELGSLCIIAGHLVCLHTCTSRICARACARACTPARAHVRACVCELGACLSPARATSFLRV